MRYRVLAGAAFRDRGPFCVHACEEQVKPDQRRARG